MADQRLKDQLVRALCNQGPIVSDAASVTDLKIQAGLDCSNTAFSSALAAAIEEHLVVRRRRLAEGLGDDDHRPIRLEATRHAESCYMRAPNERSSYFAAVR